MVLLGTLVNGVAIIIGSLLGLIFKRIPERVKTTVMQAIALAVILLGIGMGLESEQFLITIGSLVIGGALGEWWRIEDHLNAFGRWIEKRVGSRDGEGLFAKGFVTASLVYVVGAMAVLGALDSGLRLDHSLLYTKAMLDGFSSLFFASMLGVGVLFSVIPVVLYQGTIALLAGLINRVIPGPLLEMFITEMTAAGGVMIVAIGLRLLGIVDIKVANLLPAILVVFVITSLLYAF
ncbi:DUF554 domain-containing protein [Natribacillus halophilus]|uniref:DUF554 domain-containing protein n=1 Tax=Natribacillus halophilus TaxID=549003 RepID=A0A1G8L259_9BACI|nr:DUF554 domain-containing protein [Natribacillus halophilus]SDI49728.1 hypothetical protein SAMN04488123_102443 [Natribacillus halophilus]